MREKLYRITDKDRADAIKLVDAAKEYLAFSQILSAGIGDITFCAAQPNEMHVYTGIEKLALSLGINILNVSYPEFSREPHKKYFRYDGIEFFELCNAEERYRALCRKFSTITLKMKEAL